jgi:hypothetical protein
MERFYMHGMRCVICIWLIFLEMSKMMIGYDYNIYRLMFASQRLIGSQMTLS